MPGYLIIAGILMIMLGLILAAILFNHKPVAVGSFSIDPGNFCLWTCLLTGSLLLLIGGLKSILEFITSATKIKGG